MKGKRMMLFTKILLNNFIIYCLLKCINIKMEISDYIEQEKLKDKPHTCCSLVSNGIST